MTDAPETSLPEDPVPTPEPEPEVAPAPTPSAVRGEPDHGPWHPSYIFLAVVSVVTLVADLGTKHWAEKKLDTPDAYFHPVELIKGYVSFVLARNKGGAWGLLQGTSEAIRRPFFLLVSALAIVFIVSLYRRLAPTQRALRVGLPLVLGGALGNLVDRIRYSWVIDFIDAHAKWGGKEHHWPTFNVADIAICVGVGLMALDMLGSRQKAHARGSLPPGPGAPLANEPPPPSHGL